MSRLIGIGPALELENISLKRMEFTPTGITGKRKIAKDEDVYAKTPNTFTHTPTSAADYEDQLSYSQIKRKRRNESLKRI